MDQGETYMYHTILSLLSLPSSLSQVDLYLPGILDDLTENLNSSMWRNRQARCEEGWEGGRMGGREGESK